MENKTKFEEVYAINVNDKTEKKDGLTYLSWAWAWAEFKKAYPTAEYRIKRFENNLPYVYDDNTGYMVFTEVTANGLTYEMWLPVMNGAKKAMKKSAYTYDVKKNEWDNEKRKYVWKGAYEQKTIEAATMFDINTAIMRCLTKNLAMFGLGLYIYAGEDLPEDENTQDQTQQSAKVVQFPKNNACNNPKTNDTPKAFEPLTRAEMVEKWGVKSAEGVVAYFEKEFGKKLEEFDECETDAARVFLEKKKQEREAKERQERYKNANGDSPFPED